jgi:hypothetical protein
MTDTRTTVRTRRIPPTDTTGTRYRVTDERTRVQRTYPADYSVRDMHATAAERFAHDALGMTAPTIDYADGRQPSRGYRFTLTERMPSNA